jgi:tetratricopeptide (TPR) repeat protein
LCERDPLYALKLGEAATAVSFALADASYPRGTIHTLRGDALKEQANAFLSLGRLPEALHAVTSAEGEYGKLPQENVGLTAVKYLRGAIYYEQDDLHAAERAAFDAADAAQRLGAADSYMNARHLLGHVLFDRCEYDAAARVFEELLRYGHATNGEAWIARASLSAGGCYLELRRIPEADRYLHEALRLFTGLGFPADITRTRWWIARLIFLQGHSAEAIYRLRCCIEEFTRQEILTEAAVVAVDLAEILHAAGRVREIRKVLANVVQIFIDAGKLTSALTALAYLKDAAADGTMTPRLTAYVREFVRRSDRQPNLLFIAPV